MFARLLAALTLLTTPAALLSPGPAAAATVRRLELPDLVRLADLVLVATVQSTEAVRTGNRIITRATLRTDTPLKGAPGETIVVETLGGVIGGIGQKVAGAARFEAGEQVVVFLGESGEGRYAVVGMAQGKLRVVPALDGTRLVRDLSGLNLVDVAPDGTLDGRGTTPAEVPLTRLVAEIARLVPADGEAPAEVEAPAAVDDATDDPRLDAPTVRP